ncbi:MAG TPA: FAD:protein FMN transferase [Longimicrobiales bacterium]|nr:FAD:protein FMN transferase [Longimicrobiales bacterium]
MRNGVVTVRGVRVPARAPAPGVLLACCAMATRFELLLPDLCPARRDHVGAARLRAAGEEALAAIVRLEAQLSCHLPGSDISRINARAAREPVRVEPALFELLSHALRLYQETEGAFDVTIGPLMRCWGFARGTGGVPGERALARARACVGMHLVDLDPRRRTVRFARPGVQLDLGGIGKGWAIDRAVLALRELGIERALLHGGTSSVYGIGAPPGEAGWKVAIEHPAAAGNACIGMVTLRDRALSVSAAHGRSFRVGDVRYGHVMDPVHAAPARQADIAAVAGAAATDGDALATALLALGPERARWLADRRPDLDVVVLAAAAAGTADLVWRRGITAPRMHEER